MANCNQLPALLSEVQRSRDSLPSDPIQFCREDTDNRRGFFRCLQNIEQARQGYNQEIADLQQKISLCEIFTGSAWNVSVRSLSAVVANRDSGRLQITSWDTDGLGPFVATMVFSQGGTGQFSFSAFNAFTREIWFIIPPLVYHGTLYVVSPSLFSFMEGTLLGDGGDPNATWFAFREDAPIGNLPDPGI